MKESLINNRKIVFPKFNRIFILFGLSTFFIAIADSIMSYFVPIVITEVGFTNTEMGLLYASSSIFGAIFDFILSKTLKSTNYKRMYLYTILLGIVFPLLLFTNSIFWFYLMAMMIWGLYYNIWNFGYYDFVAREQKTGSHASSFGFLSMFNDLGYVIGPLIAAQFVLREGSLFPIVTPIFGFFLGMLFLIGIYLIQKKARKKNKLISDENGRNVTFLKEAGLWLKIGRHMWPVLLLGTFLSITEAVYWTVTPLLEDVSTNLAHFGGIIMAASLAPSLFINWSVGVFTSKFGQKYTAYVSFLLSNLILLTVGFVSDPYIIIILIFLSSLFEALAFPAIAGAVADYLKESKSFDNEILSVKDFFGNVGYIIGPIFAGIMLDEIGSLMIFTYFAAIGLFVSLILIFFSPKSIDFHDRSIK